MKKIFCAPVSVCHVSESSPQILPLYSVNTRYKGVCLCCGNAPGVNRSSHSAKGHDHTMIHRDRRAILHHDIIERQSVTSLEDTESVISLSVQVSRSRSFQRSKQTFPFLHPSLCSSSDIQIFIAQSTSSSHSTEQDRLSVRSAKGHPTVLFPYYCMPKKLYSRNTKPPAA